MYIIYTLYIYMYILYRLYGGLPLRPNSFYELVLAQLRRHGLREHCRTHKEPWLHTQGALSNTLSPS